jgi:hypothetical protein
MLTGVHEQIQRAFDKARGQGGTQAVGLPLPRPRTAVRKPRPSLQELAAPLFAICDRNPRYFATRHINAQEGFILHGSRRPFAEEAAELVQESLKVVDKLAAHTQVRHEA